MAITGIIQRLGLKISLDGEDSPVEGEIVFATDTGEHGWLDENGDLQWTKLNAAPSAPTKTVIFTPGDTD